MGHELVGVTASLYDFIVDSEAPLSAPISSFHAARERVTAGAQELMAAFGEVRARAATPFVLKIDEAVAALRELAAELRAHHPAPDRLQRLWKGLGTTYESLRAQLPALVKGDPAREVKPAPLKPKNLTRNLFHVSMALTGVLLYQFVLDRLGTVLVTGALSLLFLGLEVLRRRSPTWNRRFSDKLFKAIIRPGEVHEVPSSTWYVIALFLGCLIYPQHAIQVGVLALGFGDPMAHLIGKRFGRRKLVGEKSLAGSLAFVGAAGLAAFVFLTLLHLAPLQALLVAGVAGVAGAVAELFSGRIDDNFTIPLVAGFAALLVL